MQTTIRQTFDALVDEIQDATQARRFFSVCDRASALGLNGGRIDVQRAVCYRFKGVDASGAMLDLHARSYDPSGPDRVRPGITRFTITATENDAVTLQYENEYEGLVRA